MALLRVARASRAIRISEQTPSNDRLWTHSGHLDAFAERGVIEYRDVVRLDWFDSRKLNDLRPLLDAFGDEPGELRRRDRMHGQAQIGVFGQRRRRRKEDNLLVQTISIGVFLGAPTPDQVRSS